MTKNIGLLCTSTLLALCLSSFAKAENEGVTKDVATRNHEGWKIDWNGYTELDSFYDSTRTFTEQSNNAPITPPGTAGGGGDSGRTQMSVRQSRLIMRLGMPDAEGWKMRGYFEGDFLGFDPTPGNATVVQSEQNFYMAPTFRLRQFYAEVSNNGWTFKVGQGWSIFGWQPYYELLNTSTAAPIGLIQRNPLVQGSKKMDIGPIGTEAAVAVARPTQKDSTIPNIDLAYRLTWDGRKSGTQNWSGTDYKLVPTSLAISGTLRQFSAPNSDGNVADKTSYMGGAVALSAQVPIITAAALDNIKNSVTFTGEIVNGNGIGDNYVGWTGGLSAMATGAGTGAFGMSNNLYPNLDNGIAGYDSSGNFQLVQFQEFTAQLQYILPFEMHSNISVSYGRLHSPNVGNLAAGTAGVSANAYDTQELYSVSYWADLTDHIRTVLEYDHMLTHYTNNTYPSNNRYGVSVLYIF